MTATQSIKSKKGAAMMWAIVFTAVVSILVALLTSLFLTSAVSSNTAKITIKRNADINQIGEYYVRCVGYSGDFPTGEPSDDFSSYTWMDETAQNFFERCRNSYHYTYTSTTNVSDEGTWRQGYRENSYIRKLTVKNANGAVVLSIAIEETLNYVDTVNGLILQYSNGAESTFKVLEWTTNDSVSEASYVQSGGFFKQLLKGIVNFISGIVVRPTNYKITYNPNGGSGAPGPATVERGQNVALPDASTMTKQGGYFLGWGKSATATSYVGSPFTPTGNTELFAIWKDYKVTLNLKGGTLSKTTYDGVIDSLPTPTREHYTFMGWSNDDNDTVEHSKGAKYVPTKNTTLYAVWKENEKKTVYYYDLSGNKNDSFTQTGYTDQSVLLKTNSYTKNPVDSWVSQECVSFDSNGGGDNPGDITWDKYTRTTYSANGWVVKGSAAQTNPTKYSNGYSYSFSKGNLSLEPYFDKATSTVYLYNGSATAALPSAPTAPQDKAFAGWYTASSGGTRIGSAGELISYPNVDTLYAQWTNTTFMLSITVNNSRYGSISQTSCNVPLEGATASVSDNNLVIKKGSTTIATITPTAAEKDDDYTYSFSKWQINGSEVSSTSVSLDSSSTVQAVFTATTNGCFAEGTLITMADGSLVPIENLKRGDMVMSWNNFTGKAEAMPISMYWNHGEGNYSVVNLTFSNGKEIKVVAEHGFFDMDLNKYVFISADNCEEYIGHNFAELDNNGAYHTITLVDAQASVERLVSYSLRTAYNDNALADGILSLTLEDFDGITTAFKFGDNLKYDEAELNKLIEKYGLYTYDEWSQYMPQEVFEIFNCKYYKIYVGLGILTENDFFTLLEGVRVNFAQ